MTHGFNDTGPRDVPTAYDLSFDGQTATGRRSMAVIEQPDGQAIIIEASIRKTQRNRFTDGLAIADHAVLWKVGLPSEPSLAGLSVDRRGHTLITLVDGTIVCVGDFLAELTGDGEHLISQDDAFHVTEVCLRARAAAETGDWMDL